MSRPSILVLGGMHGNEQLGIQLVALLKQSPLTGVDALIANPKAVIQSKRFIQTDLNRSFGVSGQSTYETNRADVLTKIASGYDVVLDFHNTQTPANNCAFVGVNCDPMLYTISGALGLVKCIEATYDCINKVCPNVISIEISSADTLDNATYWYEKIQKLLKFDQSRNIPIETFKYKTRLTWEQKKQFDTSTWRPFEPLEKSVTDKLGLGGIIVPIFIGSKLTEYYATLLSKERNM